MKVAEEAGEAAGALIGLTGTNTRKGHTHSVDDLRGELLDVAATALIAVEHLTDNSGSSEELLRRHIQCLYDRAIFTTEPTERLVSEWKRDAAARRDARHTADDPEPALPRRSRARRRKAVCKKAPDRKHEYGPKQRHRIPFTNGPALTWTVTACIHCGRQEWGK